MTKSGHKRVDSGRSLFSLTRFLAENIIYLLSFGVPMQSLYSSSKFALTSLQT